MKPKRFSFLPLVISFLTVLFLSFGLLRNNLVCSKEVEATNEWTLLGDNDTVAAGMHIRMDLASGQKWVKLPDQPPAVIKDAEISSTGAVVLSKAEENENVSSADPILEKQSTNTKADYDFDMMHRALAQLPPEEKELLQLPEAPPPTITREQREIYEKRMRDIWLARQESLKRFEEEFLVDLPQVLKDCITKLEDYFADPKMALLAVAKAQHMGGVEHDTNILSVLKDLEYHLSDIDMTRDFHTLGGWPLVVSLLSSNVHDQRSNQTITGTIRPIRDAVQAHAAWVVGTAVKNTLEFNAYVLEPISIGSRSTTALDMLADEILNLIAEERSQQEEQKLHKYLYALGSFLRANRDAQVHFCARNGPEELGTFVLDSSKFGALSLVRAKTINRIFTLVEDIITDVQLHASKSKQMDTAVSDAFSSETWCLATLQALQNNSDIQENAIRALSQMNCEWDESMHVSLERVKQMWQATASFDSDVQREKLELLDKVIIRIKP